MTDILIAKKAPLTVEVEEGRDLFLVFVREKRKPTIL